MREILLKEKAPQPQADECPSPSHVIYLHLKSSYSFAESLQNHAPIVLKTSNLIENKTGFILMDWKI